MAFAPLSPPPLPSLPFVRDLTHFAENICPEAQPDLFASEVGEEEACCIPLSKRGARTAFLSFEAKRPLIQYSLTIALSTYT